MEGRVLMLRAGCGAVPIHCFCTPCRSYSHPQIPLVLHPLSHPLIPLLLHPLQIMLTSTTCRSSTHSPHPSLVLHPLQTIPTSTTYLHQSTRQPYSSSTRCDTVCRCSSSQPLALARKWC